MGRRGEGHQGLAELWSSPRMVPGGGAEALPGLSWLGGTAPPQGQEGACRWEMAMIVLGFGVDGGHEEALEQPWLGDEGALWRSSIPLHCSATSCCEPAWGNPHPGQGSEPGPSYHLFK